MQTQTRTPGCQSTNHRECYGEMWQCKRCEKMVCYAEGTDDDLDLCDDCWVQVHLVGRNKPKTSSCPKMQGLIEKLAYKHHCDVKTVGTQLWLALPDSRERLMIAGLSSQRVGLTHCIADTAGYLALDLDLVFVVIDEQFEPVEAVHSLETGQLYHTATGEDANNGAVDLVRFSEYIANLLEAQRWVVDAHQLSGLGTL